jgi:5-methylcytosine-specific restriction endonuclease McrA
MTDRLERTTALQRATDEQFAAAIAESRSLTEAMQRLGISKFYWQDTKKRASAYDQSHFVRIRRISDAELAAAIKASRNYAEMCGRLGTSSHPDHYKRRAQSFDCSHFIPVRKRTDEEVVEAVKRSWSLESLRVHLEYALSGSVYQRLRQRMATLGLSQNDFCEAPPRARVGSRPLSRDEVFRKREKKREARSQSGETLRAALLREGREHKCAECGLGPKWNGQPLVLQVDHINGDRLDDSWENLRFLCPNCHTQTPTFCGRNKFERPETALRLIKGGAAQSA